MTPFNVTITKLGQTLWSHRLGKRRSGKNQRERERRAWTVACGCGGRGAGGCLAVEEGTEGINGDGKIKQNKKNPLLLYFTKNLTVSILLKGTKLL